MNLNLTAATRYGLNVLALLGGSVALYLGRSIFIPLIIAVLLAAILYPSARRLHERYKLPWFLSCAGAIGLLVFLFLATFVGLAASVPRLLEDLPPPGDEARQIALYERFRDQVQSILPVPIDEALPKDAQQSGFFQYVRQTLTRGYVTDALLDLSKAGLGILFQGVLILFIVLFMMLEGELLARKVRNIFGPGPGTQKAVTAALGEMAEAVRSYLVWRTIVNCGLALVLGVTYKAIGLKQAYLWAILTAILCYVPYLGTLAAGVPPIVEALVQPDLGVGPAAGILIFYMALVTFEGYVVVPWVMGRSMDLNATTVLLACLYWDLVWGTAGLFLAMPLMAAVKAVCLHVEGWDAWGRLMGSGEDDPPPADAEVVPLSAPPADDKTVIMERPPVAPREAQP